MRKVIFIVSCIFIHAAVCMAEGQVRLATDKQVYVAGEKILCAVSYHDGGILSAASGVAYVVLVSADGLAAKAKIALRGGLGAGYVPLPGNIPTGAYRIFAYTSDCRYAQTADLLIFNTGSSSRVHGGVQISDAPVPVPSSVSVMPEGIRMIREQKGDSLCFTIVNESGHSVALAVSVFEDDGLRPDSSSVRIPLPGGAFESEGEIIRARVFGKDAEKVIKSPWMEAMISAPGSPSDTYTAPIGKDGLVEFRTNNIYGDKDLVCEILGAEEEKIDCHFSPLSPFLDVPDMEFPKMKLSAGMKPALLARHRAVLTDSPVLDTLYEFLPKRDNLLFSNEDCIRYCLDDYTRFSKVEDIISELIPDVIVRNVRGEKRIKLVLKDIPSKKKTDNVLVLLDGVPVTVHERLLAFDAMALGEVQVYPYVYALGKTVFNGAVNFVTTRHDMSALIFDDNVLIMDFVGCSYPVALRSGKRSAVSGGRTLYWDPAASLENGASLQFGVSSDSRNISAVVTRMD